MSAGIPLAWLQLTRERRRFIAAIVGISFAVVLMLTQLGFQDALLSSVGGVHQSLVADLVMINPGYRNITQPRNFSELRLYQALAFDSVDSVYPFYVASGPFKNPFDRSDRFIYMFGFHPGSVVFNRPGIAENLKLVRTRGNVLFDSIHRPEFGPVETVVPVSTEIYGKRIEIVGLYQLGTSFGIDGSVVMSDETFLHITGRQRGIIDIGLIRLKPGADAVRTKAELTKILPEDVEVLTHQEFLEREVGYWTASTPIGFVFGLGVLVGIFIGCIIVYQILYTDVTAHLPEYATIKAMGYSNWFLVKVVMNEAFILSFMGFLPGVVASYFVYAIAHAATLLPMSLTVPRLAAVYVLTFVMCAISALLAARRLKAADPAEIF